MSLLGTVILMPKMIRYASRLGLLDDPSDERKVHTEFIPRCGGIAIALASVLPLYFWLPMGEQALGVIVGGAIVCIFGLADDIFELNYKWKFIGQILAVLCLLRFGVVVVDVPFLSRDFVFYREVGYLITFFFILGCINAVNLSDGLDGLAAGVSLLSLVLIAIYSNIVGSVAATVIAIIAIGGLLGFLRFNTYPAQVFLGDTGSQLAGYVLSALLVLVTQVDGSYLSTMLPVVVLGIPIFDTVMVMLIRVKSGRSPFSPDRNHLHHQLMKSGLPHYRAVAVIYLMQVFLLCVSYLLRYESNLTLLVFYVSFCFMLSTMLFVMSGKFSLADELLVVDAGILQKDKRNSLLRRFEWFYKNSPYVIQVFLLAAFFLVFSVADKISDPLSIFLMVFSCLLYVTYFFSAVSRSMSVRFVLYGGAVVVTYLLSLLDESNIMVAVVDVYLLAFVFVLGLAIRMTRREFFRLDNQDLLVFIAVLAVSQLPFESVDKYSVDHFTFRIIVFFYACEFLVSRTDFSKKLVCRVVPLSVFSLSLFTYLY